MLRGYWKSLDKISDKLTKKFKVNEARMIKQSVFVLNK